MSDQPRRGRVRRHRAIAKLIRFGQGLVIVTLLANQQGILPMAVAGEITGGTEETQPGKLAQPNGRVIAANPVQIMVPDGGGGPAADPTIGGEPLFLPYTPPDEVSELADERTRQTRTLAKPDGSFTVEASNGPVNYLDAAGAWQPIDLSLVPAEDGAYKIAANSGSMTINTAAGELGVIEVDGHRVALSAPGYGKLSVGEDVDANKISFAEALGTEPEIWIRPIDVGLEFGATWPNAATQVARRDLERWPKSPCPVRLAGWPCNCGVCDSNDNEWLGARSARRNYKSSATSRPGLGHGHRVHLPAAWPS